LAGRLRCAAFTAPPTTCGVTKSKPVPRTFHPVRVATEYAPGGSVTSRNTPSGESRSTRRSPSAIGSSGGLGGGVMSPFTVSRSSPGGVRARAGRIAHVVGARVRVGGAAAAARAEVTGGVAAGVSGLGAVVAFLGRADDVITAAVAPGADAAPATVGGRGAARDAGA